MFLRYLSYVLVTILPLIFLNAVSAQEKKTYALEELIVTAQKTVETQQDVAASFNVYGAQNLEATGWDNVTDMADLIPSMEVIGVTKTRTTVFIRSIGTNKYDIGTEGSIGVFVDGVYIPRFSSLMQNLIDLERVEVLRGPQGTLYGRNTIGGAISLYSKEPAEEFQGKATVGVGNEDTLNVSATVSGPLTEEGNLLGYLAMANRDTGGFRTAVASDRDRTTEGFSKETDDEHVTAARTKLTWFYNDELTLGVTAEYTDQEVDSFTGELIANTGDRLFALSSFVPQELVDQVILDERADQYESVVNDPGFTEVNSFALSFKAEWIGEDLAMESIVGYRDEDVVEFVDNDRVTFDTISQGVDQSSKTTSIEFKISSEAGGIYTFDDTIDWLAGVFLYNDDADRLDDVNLGADVGVDGLLALLTESPPEGPVPLSFLVDLETDSWAVFGQGTYYFTDEWSVTAGVRFSRDTKEFTYTATTPGFSPSELNYGSVPQLQFASVALGDPIIGLAAPLLAGTPFTFFEADNFIVEDKLTFESTDPKIAIEYEPEWADDLMGYLSYSQGYKSGGIQFIARRVSTASDSFDKEILKAWETGIKSRWFDQSLQINGAIYKYDYDGQQIQAIAVVDDTTQVISDNASGSELNGAELDVQYRATEFLILQGSVSYLDAVFTDYTRVSNVDIDGNGEIDDLVTFDGNVMPAAPQWSYWLSAEYEMPWENGWSSGMRVDYSWRDDQVFTPDGIYTQDDYAIMNLSYWINDPDEVWKFRVFCKNCEDTDYRSAVTPLTNDGSGQTGWAGTGDKRRYGIEMTYYF